ncbi:MAG: ABC transporter substrate-binding protein [Ignavibacteriae bacterium]|nr:ABC transporter substrate-binding protein [Ignavibacteriota bacterium]
MGKRGILLILALPLLFFLSGCGKTKLKKVFDTKPESIKQYDTPPGADLNVPAGLGGNGFKGEGWETNNDYTSLGSPKAVKGGSFNISFKDFPVTLRTEGKESNTAFNAAIASLLYEPLLNLDPATNDYIPSLATHWQISPDKMTFKFRINPDARWADGKPVTSEDVLATWKLMADAGILSPYVNEVYGAFEQPVAESKYIVSVKSKHLNWRQFLYFANSMRILPAHIIGNLSGKDYLEKYQFEYIIGSGPYFISTKDIKKNESIIVRRRSDYWGEKEKFSLGRNNFDLIKFEFNKDENLEYEKFKKGELDLIFVGRAQWWEEKFSFDEVSRGIVVKKRIFNEIPRGISGLAFNMRKSPFDDIKIRKAFCYLYDRKKFNEKLFYNSYFYISSFFPGSVYANPRNPVTGFSPDSAAALLSQAGWKERNSEGWLVKDGKILEVELPFVKPQDRYLTVYQEDLKKAGVKLDLKEIDQMTVFKLGNERNFNLITINWSGLQIPNPESVMSSTSADSANTVNYSGLKDSGIDSLLNLYNISFGNEQRIRILKQIDSLAVNYYPIILGWYPPYIRIAFQNKFGFPECMIGRTSDETIAFTLWFNDPGKYAEYEQALTDKNIKLPVSDTDNKYWLDKK